MTQPTDDKRIDTASRIIKASAQKIYRAFLDPKAIAAWRPPEGMTCKIYSFDPHEGGMYKMSFRYTDSQHAVPGKTAEEEDVFKGQFLKLTPHKQLIELVTFESDDPAFAGAMTVTTNLTPVAAGTEVTFVCQHVPAGIKPEDHQQGMRSTLKNLAHFTE